MDLGSLSGDASRQHNHHRIHHGIIGGIPGTGSPIRKLDKPLISNYGIANGFIGSNDRLFCHGDPCEHLYSDRYHLLIALSAKNGILIVEFARDFRAEGNSIRDAAYEAGHVRLRPILMTSFAFVLGVMPLLFATGAGAQSRIALGAAVVFGMALNTLLATIYIPNFYELMQKFQENVLDRKKKK